MTEVLESIQAIARLLWDMEQRVAVQIAEKSPELREAAFAVVQREVRETVRRMGIVPDDKMDEFMKLQMKVIRQFVADIDVGGSPQGGNA